MLRCWPPAPVPEYHSTRKSRSLNSTGRTDSASTTATVTVDVWTLPLRSVGGTRCMRWPPGSLSRPTKSLPHTSIDIAATLSTGRCLQPTRSKNRMYAEAKSLANNFESSPPSAGRISSIRFIGNLFGSLVARTQGIEPRQQDLESRSPALEHWHAWCREMDSNHRRTRLQRAALPTELSRLETGGAGRIRTCDELSVLVGYSHAPYRSGTAPVVRSANSGSREIARGQGLHS